MVYPAKQNLAIYRGDDSKWPMQIRYAQEYTDGVTVLGSTSLTSATAAFTAEDVNRTVQISDTSFKIITVISAQEVTLDSAAASSNNITTFYIWRPLDLTAYILTAKAKTSPNSNVVASFTITITDAVNGRFDLIMPKEESVNITTNLWWDLQTVDSSNNDWTETILAGSIVPAGQIT